MERVKLIISWRKKIKETKLHLSFLIIKEVVYCQFLAVSPTFQMSSKVKKQTVMKNLKLVTLILSKWYLICTKEMQMNVALRVPTMAFFLEWIGPGFWILVLLTNGTRWSQKRKKKNLLLRKTYGFYVLRLQSSPLISADV